VEASGRGNTAGRASAAESVATSSVAASLEFPSASISIAANLVSGINASTEAPHSRVGWLAIQ
jgi:hypothetical protein